MKLRLGLAMLALAASMSGASAKTVTYSLADNTGTPLCSGVTMNETYTKKQNLATGTIFESACTDAPPDLAVGGLYGGLTAVSHKVWSAVGLTTIEDTPVTIALYLDQKNLHWYGYYNAFGEWFPVADGELIDGYPPPSGHAGKSLLSAVKAAVKLAKPPVNRSTTQVLYEFADRDGNPLCDGLLLWETSTDESGFHYTPVEGCQAGEDVSGPKGHVPNYTTVGNGRTVYMLQTNSLGNMQYAYVIDEAALTWTLFAESADGTTAWHAANYGTLLPACTCARNTGLKKSSLTGIK